MADHRLQHTTMNIVENAGLSLHLLQSTRLKNAQIAEKKKSSRSSR